MSVRRDGHGDVCEGRVIRCWYLTASELPFENLARAAAVVSALVQLVMSDRGALPQRVIQAGFVAQLMRTAAADGGSLRRLVNGMLVSACARRFR